MKNLFLVILLAIFLLFFGQSVFAQDAFCVFYFTYIGCPNCAYTDPMVLSEWPQKYPNLVVIEYMWYGGEWEDPNVQFFGNYVQKYHLQASVPQIVINEDKNFLGRIEVPQAEKYIKSGTSSTCSLIDGSVSFEELTLSKLPAQPKIWTKDKVLIALGNNDWLFQWNGERPEILDDLKSETVEPREVEFSGIAFPDSGLVPYASFENAVKIKLSGIPSVAKLMGFEAELQTEEEESSTESDEEETTEPEIEPPIEEEELSGELEEGEITIPLFGVLKTKKLSLPVLTFLLGIADGFNPCAFFILTFLLAALIGLAGARKKIILVGGIFIFFSALFYFLFMSVLLNVFQLGERIIILTFLAGMIAVFAGIINVKDYFAFQKGISLTTGLYRKEGISPMRYQWGFSFMWLPGPLKSLTRGGENRIIFPSLSF